MCRVIKACCKKRQLITDTNVVNECVDNDWSRRPLNSEIIASDLAYLGNETVSHAVCAITDEIGTSVIELTSVVLGANG